jgi:hypothetical protein
MLLQKWLDMFCMYNSRIHAYAWHFIIVDKSILKIYALVYFISCFLSYKLTLSWIFRKWDVGAWTRWNWLRIGTGGRHL